MTFFARLNCPVCGAAISDDLVCGACSFRGRTDGTIIDLRADPTKDTALDLASYDATHGVTEAPSRHLFDVYDGIARSHGCAIDGDVLEIGAGTGNLTLALLAYSPSARIAASDLSPRFLELLVRRAHSHPGRDRLSLYLFDGSRFPFPEASVDFVFGHSILHHILHFEQTLAEACRVLRPGALAIFGEPMMDTLALVCLSAVLIADADKENPAPRLSKQLSIRLSQVGSLGRLKRQNFLERDDRTDAFEDKFVFARQDLERVARDVGFRDYSVHQDGRAPDLAEIARERVLLFCRDIPGAKEQLQAYDWVFRRLRETYQASLPGDSVSRLFAYNVFQR
jgi:ubiquinone/menaquinone biosynthesis C-methylase UbiE